MKLLELEIRNVRGIWDLDLKPGGENLVIHGPNGSGKSAVVDAVDFLLTGRISRLMGEGTGGITLRQHGPHILHRPKDAEVRAVLKLPGVQDPVEIRRCIAHPDELVCDEAIRPHLQPVLALAARGQHLLTRRAILKYITAESATRAEQIQDLLNIAEIEGIRRSLVRTSNDLDRERQTAVRAVRMAEPVVSGTLGQKGFDAEQILAAVNQVRTQLGGEAIAELASTNLKSGLSAPMPIASGEPNLVLIQKDIASLRESVAEASSGELAGLDSALQGLIATVTENPEVQRLVELVSLTEMGLSLIDETGRCPLCETPWPPGELREVLEKRLGLAQAAQEQLAAILNAASAIAEHVRRMSARVSAAEVAAESVRANEDAAALEAWLSHLQALLDALDAPVASYIPLVAKRSLEQLLMPAGIDQALEHVLAVAAAECAPTTPEWTAWETLTRLEENLKALERAQRQLALAAASRSRAALLLGAFLRARDSVLGALYDSIRDRFVSLYRHLHALDEDGFSAVLEPDGAGLKFEVGFHGHGTHPPHALHSEGHQDSMGVCLYLALAERLNQGVIDLIILDDVVMSVDAGHRRRFCQLLANSFPNHQFLITTHDTTWARQLAGEGVVKSRSIVQLCNWHLESGPVMTSEGDLWQALETDLRSSNVPAAAAKLRRSLEQFYAFACDGLWAPVRYRLNGQAELGDVLPAAMNQFNRLLGKAKDAANSRDDREQIEMLSRVQDVARSVFARTRAEQWGINANVHYNHWADFAPEDFVPIVEAFHDLERVFTCSECGGIIGIAARGPIPTAVLCGCGKVNWSLVRKAS